VLKSTKFSKSSNSLSHENGSITLTSGIIGDEPILAGQPQQQQTVH